MKGANSLRINVETMVEALQLWVDAKFVAGEAPKVVSAKEIEGEYIFEVHLREKETAQQEMDVD